MQLTTQLPKRTNTISSLSKGIKKPATRSQAKKQENQRATREEEQEEEKRPKGKLDESTFSSLECNICFEKMKEPTSLIPCLHTFCKECIE